MFFSCPLSGHTVTSVDHLVLKALSWGYRNVWHLTSYILCCLVYYCSTGLDLDLNARLPAQFAREVRLLGMLVPPTTGFSCPSCYRKSEANTQCPSSQERTPDVGISSHQVLAIRLAPIRLGSSIVHSEQLWHALTQVNLRRHRTLRLC